MSMLHCLLSSPHARSQCVPAFLVDLVIYMCTVSLLHGSICWRWIIGGWDRQIHSICLYSKGYNLCKRSQQILTISLGLLQTDISNDNRAMQKLRREVERAKRALSSQHQVRRRCSKHRTTPCYARCYKRPACVWGWQSNMRVSRLGRGGGGGRGGRCGWRSSP